MSAKSDSKFDEIAHFPGGAFCCQGIFMEPYPNLRISPDRDHRFTEAIIWATPQSRYWAYASTIPPQVRDLVKATPHWGLVELCAAHPRGIELLESCPALAMLVIEGGQFLPHTERRQRLQALLAGPWRSMLSSLGLPARPRTLRLLRKLPRAHCQQMVVAKLKKVLVANSHLLRFASHLPHLTRDTVSLLDYMPEFVTPRLLLASTESDPDLESVRLLISAVRSARCGLGLSGPWPYAGAGVDELERIHARLVTRLAPWEMERFPESPFRSRERKIVAIETVQDLKRESETMRHCGFTFLPECRTGRVCFFKILHPERATLALRQDDLSKEWSVEDIRAAGNAEVSPNTWDFVYAWFAAECCSHEEGD